MALPAPATTDARLARIPPETRIAIVVGVSVLMISLLPFGLAFAAQPADAIFGGAILDVEDVRSHLAKMHLGYRGEWRFQMLYTPEEHRAALVNIFYLALGHLARVLRLPLITVYHLARVLCGGVFLLSVHRFASAFLPTLRMRLTAFLLAVVGSGLGWITLFSGTTRWLGLTPIDFWLIDGFSFLIVFTFPHLALSTGLLLEILRLASGSLAKPQTRSLIALASASALFMVLQPFQILLIGAVLGGAWALLTVQARRLHWPGLRTIAAVAIGAAPPLLYILPLLRTDPIFRAWSAQNLLPSPGPWYYVMGYAPFLPLAAAGAIEAARRRSARDLFLLAWLGAVPVLLYLPIEFQHRMSVGLPVVLAVLGARGWDRSLWPWIERRAAVRALTNRRGYTRPGLARLGLVALVSFAALSNLYVIAGAVISVLRQDEALFHPRWQVTAVDWLGSHTAPEETVLGAYATGSIIPARIGHRVFMGHWSETVALDEKQELARTFFQADTDDGVRRMILEEYRIGYLFYGPEELALGDFSPEGASYLIPTYSSAEVTIYRVLSSPFVEAIHDG